MKTILTNEKRLTLLQQLETNCIQNIINVCNIKISRHLITTIFNYVKAIKHKVPHVTHNFKAKWTVITFKNTLLWVKAWPMKQRVYELNLEQAI